MNKKTTAKLHTFLLGGSMYGCLEVAWRGYTHISMFIAGGLCLLMLYHLSITKFGFVHKCILGGLGITLVEFITGCIVNLWLKLGVWDYSNEVHHFLGQICPRYLAMWCSLSAIVIAVYEFTFNPAAIKQQISRAMRASVFKEKKSVT